MSQRVIETDNIEVKANSDELDELVRFAEEFLQGDATKLDFQRVVDDAASLSGGRHVVLNLYAQCGMEYTTVALSGCSPLIKQAERLLGFSIVGRAWSHDLRRDERIKHGTITRFPRLSDLTGGVIPASLTDRISGLFGVGEVILVKIMTGKEMLGDLTVFMPAEAHFRNHRMLEAYSRLLGLALARRRAEDLLETQRRRLENIIDSAELGTWQWNVETDETVFNERWAEMLGYTLEELSPTTMDVWRRLTHTEDRRKAREQLVELFARERDRYSVELRMRHKDGSWVWMLSQGNVIEWSADGKPKNMAGVHVDISDRRRSEEALLASEERYIQLVSRMPLGLALHEIVLGEKGEPIDYIFLDVNPQFEIFTGLCRSDVVGRRVLEVLPDMKRDWIDKYGHVAVTGESIQFESYSENLGRHYEVTAYSPAPGQFATVFNDVTDRHLSQERIHYLDTRDYLTGMHNRKSFEEQLLLLDSPDQWPLSIVIADVNGLKLINDSFGWQTGDELLRRVAQLMLLSSRPDDVVARLGGDEFAVIMPRAGSDEAMKTIERMRYHAQDELVDGIELSVSFGYDTKEEASLTTQSMLKVAEDYMHRRKLYEQSSMRSKTIGLIMNTLFAKSQREAGHSARVGNLCRHLGEKMGLDGDMNKQLRLAGLMHDIGKIGVSEAVLNKPRQLDEVEWRTVRQHPETGYRILSASSEFADIAQYVLEHQERWDGAGYPSGLKGEEISLPARIIAVVDAFDAMTIDRPYRKALTVAEAIDELGLGAGQQFDPEIVSAFVDLLGTDLFA